MTKQRPIEGTDEYQAGWVGLLYACQNYRDTSTPFPKFMKCCIRHAIEEDRIGSAAVQRALRGKSFEPIDQHSDTGGPGTVHPFSRDRNPVDHAIGKELWQRIKDARLSPQQQLVVQRIIFEQKSFDEIRQEDGIVFPGQAFTKARKRLIESLRWPWSGVEDVVDKVGSVRASPVVQQRRAA